MAELPVLEQAWLLIEDGLISDYGTGRAPDTNVDQIVDASGRTVLPGWIDSHTHIVYAGNREKEFVDRINGLNYEEIAARGGGILNSAALLRQTSEEDLYRQSARRLEEVIKMGTTAIEIKSGYGLTTEAELKMLRVIRSLSQAYPLEIQATFLGAHAIPKEYRQNREGYIDLLCKEMIPSVAKENLAQYIDVFCEENYFSVSETDRILAAGLEHGLQPKVHVNQFNSIGGIKSAIKHKAVSVDHLEELTDEDIQHLKSSDTLPVSLPSCSFFLGIPYTPARKMLDAGLPLALASDYNPGSTPSGNMNFVVALACIKMQLTPEEAINAATINAAYAMNLSESHGSITRGKIANLIMTEDIPSYQFLPYAFGNNHISKVFINGTAIL